MYSFPWKSLVILLFSLGPAAPVGAAEPLSIKGYTIGQAISDCPESTVRQVDVGDGQKACALAKETYAGESGVVILVMHINSAVSAVSVSLPKKGIKSNAGVLNALHERWGPPYESKPHINTAKWERDGVSIRFDGMAGTVLLINEAEQIARNKARAGSVRKDM